MGKRGGREKGNEGGGVRVKGSVRWGKREGKGGEGRWGTWMTMGRTLSTLAEMGDRGRV